MGFRLQGDLSLQRFLLNLVNSGELKEIVNEIRESRPDLLGNEGTGPDDVEGQREQEDKGLRAIAEQLLDATDAWVVTRDSAVLQARLSEVLRKLGGEQANEQ
jgi:hypothetical protein